MGGTNPTPTQPQPTPTRATPTSDPTPSYGYATPTSSDSMTVGTTRGQRLRQFALDQGKLFVTKFNGAAAGALATKAVDYAIPSQGVDGTAYLSPRDAQHIPKRWIDGFRGHPYGDKKTAYWTDVAGSDVPKGSLFTNISLAKDTWMYTSPFTLNNYVATKGLRQVDRFLQKYERETVGGIIPLYAWGVRENEVTLLPSGTKLRYKTATGMFIKEVFDDWMACHGYDRYDALVDALPAAGWPGLVRLGDPWHGKGVDDSTYTGDIPPGWRNWSSANEAIAHFEYGEQPVSERQQLLRYAKYYVDSGGNTKLIDYPEGSSEVVPRDTVPFEVPTSDIVVRGDVPEDAAVEAEDHLDGVVPPTMADYEALMGDDMDTDIPVLPSQPPAGDDDDDDEEDFYDYEYIPVLRGVDMNVGDAAYYDQAGDEVLRAGGQDMQDPQQSQTLFGPLQEVYGFVYGNGRAYGNTMVPGVMSMDKHFNYNGDYDYWSKMVTRTTSRSKVVGFLYSNRSTNTAPAHVYGDMVMSATGFELRDQDSLVAFNYGRPIDDSVSSNDLANWLIQKTWNGSQPNGAAFCRAFELDMSTGEGYTNGLM